MSDSTQRLSGAPPSIPIRTPSKRTASEGLEQLERKRQDLAVAVKESRKKLTEHNNYSDE